MTTSHSPLRVLKGQAARIAERMKAIERGEVSDPKIDAARAAGLFKIGVVMDDKIITLKITADKIRECSEAALAEYVLRLMKGERDKGH